LGRLPFKVVVFSVEALREKFGLLGMAFGAVGCSADGVWPLLIPFPLCMIFDFSGGEVLLRNTCGRVSR